MEREDAIGELSEQKYVDEVIDPGFKYHLRPPKMCEIGDLDRKEDALHYCPLFRRGIPYDFKKDYAILQMENGGVSISDYLRKVTTAPPRSNLELFRTRPKLQNIESAKRFIFGMENLFEGLVDFYDNEFIHFDLKTTNIVYNEDENRFNFIDFGLSSSYKDIIKFVNSNDKRFRYGYYITPMELWFIPNNTTSTTGLYMKLSKFYDGGSYDYLMNREIVTNDIYLEPMRESLEDELYKPLFESSGKTYIAHVVDMIGGVDTYGIGILLVEILVSFSNKKFTYGGSEDIIDPFYKDVSRLIHEMIHPFYGKRILPQDALIKFRDIKSKYITYMSPGVGAAAAASGSGGGRRSNKKTKSKKHKTKSHIKRGRRKNKKRTNRRRK